MEITNPHKEFLHLCVVEQMSYEDISKELNVPRKTLSEWYEELKEERIILSEIRGLWSRKRMEPHISFMDFHKWYLDQDKKCFYCEIPEDKLVELINSEKVKTNRARGRKLELDRKDAESLLYDNLDNFVFACYWCNNAKTDTFTSIEFKEVGKEFKKIWEKRGL